MSLNRMSLSRSALKGATINGANGVNGVNGVNGHSSSQASSPVTVHRHSSSSYSFRSSSMNGGETSNAYVVRNTAQMLEKKGTAELGYGVFESVSSTTFIKLVEFIGAERLSSLPHKGGKWDKVLIRALYFAEQQHAFEKMMKRFGAEDTSAANLAYGYCKLLLELGHGNAAALDKAFTVLYKHSLEVASLLHRTELITTTPQIREQLLLMYGDLLTLTSAVATRYYKSVHGMTSGRVSLDIYEICGSAVESFRDRQSQVSELIWNHQAQIEGYDIEQGVSAKAMKRWLVPNDKVLTTLTQEHTTLLDGQAEFTCIWFQKPLAQFVQGTDKVMSVTGQTGSGKSVLAASIVERLQRPLGKKSFSTLFHSINKDVPSAATPISILKSLLAQIFDLRVGNMQTYYAIEQAYEKCQYCTELSHYENHLWTALEEALKKPLENARDLVLVVDGLDELTGGHASANSFVERLTKAVREGKRTKLVGLAQSLSIPAGTDTTQVSVTRENVHDDIHAVILKNLMHSRYLTSKPGPEQEQLLERLAKASNGSFVWATLTSHILVETKTQDEFTKVFDEVEKSKPSVQDLVQRIISKHELSGPAKTIISWIVTAERPLSVHDIQTLWTFGITPTKDTDTEVDVVDILRPLEPLLSFSDNIVRFKHHSIDEAVTTIVDSGKIGIPKDTRQADIIARSLQYTKTVLRDEPDPTFDDYEPDTLEQSFKDHPLLSYVVRYWTIHVQRVGISKLPKDLSKALPNTALLSMIERTLWTLELPLPQNLDLNKTALDVRLKTLTERSPAVLQSSINTALLYDLLGRPYDAAELYYWCTETSKNVLSHHHPLPVELGYRFLRSTDNLIETKRTETMTRREEVLKILITIMEKQYGVSSTQVIQIRTQLAQFYEHIHEEQRATEIYQTIQKATVQVHGKDSTQARQISDHLQVSLGKSKSDRQIETRKESIFDEDDENDDDEVLDLTTVSRRLQTAKNEREFVELWQQVSAIAQHTSAIEWHERNIDVATAYSKYLQSQKRTNESASVLSSISREYESHQASFSEQIMSRLSTTAMSLKELGYYTAALAVLKRTSEFYHSLKREDSHQYSEIQRQISTVMTEVVQSSSTDAHSDTLEEIFRTTIKDERKSVDAKIMAIAKTLTTRYMDQSKPSGAIEIITLVLHRTWPHFLTAPVNEVDMPTTFPKETIELVELLVQCYTHLRQLDNVEKTLLKLFNVTLTQSKVDFAYLNKIQKLLIDYYDKYNIPEKAVVVLQKTLPARRTGLGPTHEDTIKTLYELGRRSRQKPRTYPFWIDYYQQIVTYLNKDSSVCEPRAFDAIIIVANTYWEDDRHSDAVPIFQVLWNTFTQKPKEHPQFSQEDFVERLYERYYYSLEQTGARFETLYQITTQYRTTVVKIFSAQSTVVTKATLALARICHTSEKHNTEALSLYEEASKHSTGTSDHKHEIQRALTTLYTREVMMSSSSSASSTTIESARSRSTEQYQASVSQYGYSHQSTLSHLHQMAVLYYKQNKTETAAKELTKASTEILTKETSSVRLIESAETIFKSFQASNNVEYCRRFTAELRRQIVCKDASKASSFGFDLTKYGRSVLPFLALFESRLSTSANVSFSQIMADLTTEMMYYEEYRRVIKANEPLDSVLATASVLRAFLVRTKRHDQVTALDNEVGSIFVARDGGKMELVSQSSARILMVAIMEYLGAHRSAPFVKAVVLASNDRLEKLMAAQQFAEAYDIAHCAFEFALENDGYSGPRGISYGFNLASDLAGVGFTPKCPDANLRKKMLHLSNDIAKKVLEVCKQQGINFTQVQMRELNRLVLLLSEQEDWETLEWLLTSLWNTREAQRSWSQKTLQNLSRRLICARYLAGHPIKALRLCEDIAYNLRRTHGASHPSTRDMNNLLGQLYTSIGQYYLQQGTKDKNNAELANSYFAKALAVHEEMLRLLVSHTADGAMDDEGDMDTVGAILAEHNISLNGIDGAQNQVETVDQTDMAKTQLRLLKLAYQRLGSWPRSWTEYERLIGQVLHSFSIDTKDTPDKWSAKGYGSGKAESTEGAFQKVDSWQLIEV